MANPKAWRGLKYPDSDLVSLIHRFARPERDSESSTPLAIDAGCGPGRHVRLLQDIGFRAVGIDDDAEMCAVARQNGVEALCVDMRTWRPPEQPALAVAWGITMVDASCTPGIAALGARTIIADWRSRNDSCRTFPDNVELSSGAVLIHRPGHVLHGKEYWFDDLESCEFPGYERRYWQQVTKLTCEGERSAWFQTVHNRCA